jgi:hypothetical protein
VYPLPSAMIGNGNQPMPVARTWFYQRDVAAPLILRPNDVRQRYGRVNHGARSVPVSREAQNGRRPGAGAATRAGLTAPLFDKPSHFVKIVK